MGTVFTGVVVLFCFLLFPYLKLCSMREKKCQCFWICRRRPFQRILVFNISGNIRFAFRSESMILVWHRWLSYYTGRRRRGINLGWRISKKMLIECFCVLNESLKDGREEITRDSILHPLVRRARPAAEPPLNLCCVC